MAQTDLTGLLTGISSTPIDPMLDASLGQRAIARGEALGKSMRQNIGAFTGANTQTTNETQALVRLTRSFIPQRVFRLLITHTNRQDRKTTLC